jgi:importin-5
VYDDLIEFAGAESVRYQQHFLQPIAAAIQDQDQDVRQAGVYGVGVAAICGGPDYLNFCTESLPLLFAIINAPDARSEENALVTENAISAVGKICRAFKDTGAFDGNQVITLWFQALPITEDEAGNFD